MLGTVLMITLSLSREEAVAACRTQLNFDAIKNACDAHVARFSGEFAEQAMRSPGCLQVESTRKEVLACADRTIAAIEAAADEKAARQKVRLEMEAAQTASDAKIARIEEEQAQARVDLANKKPKLAQTALSFMLCHNLEVRSATKKEIADELKYAHEGAGIVDKSKMYEAQQQLKQADDANAELLAALKRRHLAAIDCKKVLPMSDDARSLMPAFGDDELVSLAAAPWLR